MSDIKAFKALSLGATICAVVLAAACTVHLRGDDNQPQATASAAQGSDPIAAELERCRSVSYEQTDRLAECRKVWAEQCRQFLKQSSDTPHKAVGPDSDSAPYPPFKNQSRLPSGLFPAPQPTER
ncbi:putative entry exclusion protein TrbK-alt [Bradyrhizobium sp. 200]|uniref:putative entry exclusion protein TrbK-alt n=1 Tax=Bradyrhizobium sp. 200 TaxID=2782665 RepID=UPI001FFF1EB6|nr:putative entry exclusion protein TrbK-alt [Bradyrhizobium sp. 200]UPJ48446.1 putative entry exclusion protein TrbK-alt [Bradyrhizobium sp. 200]